MKNRLKSFLRDRNGAAAAEMALILPAALALIFTTFEGGYYMLLEHRVVKGVRDAARYAGRLDMSNFTCPAGTFSGPVANVKNLARTGELTGGTAKVPDWTNDQVTITVRCTADQGGIYNSTGNYAPLIEVSAQVAYPSLFAQMGFTSDPIFLRAAAESPVMGL